MDEKEFDYYIYGKAPTIYLGVFNSTDKDMYAELTMQGSNPNSNTFLTLTLRARAEVEKIWWTMLENEFDYRDFIHWDVDMPQEAFMKKLWKEIKFEW